MPSFSALPPELLLLICEHVDSGDIVSFSVLNRRTHEIAKPVLDALWAEYGSFAQTTDLALWFWHGLLHSVVAGWGCSKYIRHLQLDESVQEPDGYYNPADDAFLED